MSRRSASPLTRTVDELKTLHSLDPTRREVYVEGRSDASFLNWYLVAHHNIDAVVYAVDDRVEIPREMVEPVHPEVNARGRLIALASEAENWDRGSTSVTCVIDADFDLFRGESPQLPTLLRTDFAALEVYALQDRPLLRLLSIVGSEATPESVLETLVPIWKSLFVLRYILHTREEGKTIVRNFASRIVDERGNVSLDVKQLVLASTNGGLSEPVEALLVRHAHHLASVTGDLQGIRGHDIAPLVARYLNLPRDLRNAETLERMMRLSLVPTDLDGHQMFSNLRNRVSS